MEEKIIQKFNSHDFQNKKSQEIEHDIFQYRRQSKSQFSSKNDLQEYDSEIVKKSITKSKLNMSKSLNQLEISKLDNSKYLIKSQEQIISVENNQINLCDFFSKAKEEVQTITETETNKIYVYEQEDPLSDMIPQDMFINNLFFNSKQLFPKKERSKKQYNIDNEYLDQIFDLQDENIEYLLENLLILYYRLQNNRFSYFYFQVSKQLHKNQDDINKQDYIQVFNIGRYYLFLSYYQKAIQVFEICLKLLQDKDDQEIQISQVMIWLGWTYLINSRQQSYFYRQSSINKALNYFEQSCIQYRYFNMIRFIGDSIAKLNYFGKSLLEDIICDLQQVAQKIVQQQDLIFFNILFLQLDYGTDNQKIQAFKQLSVAIQNKQQIYLLLAVLRLIQLKKQQKDENYVQHSLNFINMVLIKEDLLDLHQKDTLQSLKLKLLQKERKSIKIFQFLEQIINKNTEQIQLRFQIIRIFLKYNLGSREDALQHLIFCSSKVNFRNIFQFEYCVKIVLQLSEIYKSTGYQMKALKYYKELQIQIQYFQKLPYDSHVFFNAVENVLRKYQKKIQDLKNLQENHHIAQDTIFQIEQILTNSQQKTFYQWISFQNNSLESQLQKLKKIDEDLYFLIYILYYKENKDNIDTLKLLERNACKFEYWFLGWFLIQKKYYKFIKIDIVHYLSIIQYKINDILLTQNYYMNLAPSFLFLLINKKIDNLDYCDMLNYFKIKMMINQNLILTLNFLQQFTKVCLEKGIYLYYILKCQTQMAQQKQIVDVQFMLSKINLFLDFKLDLNIPDQYHSNLWGKIFYLFAEYIYLTEPNSENINYFYGISTQIFQKTQNLKYLTSNKRYHFN